MYIMYMGAFIRFGEPVPTHANITVTPLIKVYIFLERQMFEIIRCYVSILSVLSNPHIEIHADNFVKKLVFAPQLHL